MSSRKQFVTISVTGNHPVFHLDKQDFVPIDQLVVGDWIATAHGGSAVVREMQVECAEGDSSFTTYNFEVVGNSCSVYSAFSSGAFFSSGG